MPGPLPQDDVTVRPDGTVVGPPSHLAGRGTRSSSNWIKLHGERKGEVTQQGLNQTGLVLWKLEQPLRLRSWISGLEPNGDIYG